MAPQNGKKQLPVKKLFSLVSPETRSISLRRWRHEKFSKSSLINLAALATISREIQFLKLDSNVRLPRSRSCILFVCVCSQDERDCQGNNREYVLLGCCISSICWHMYTRLLQIQFLRTTYAYIMKYRYMLFVIRLGIFTNMNKEIEVYFILLNVIMNEYCILDILYRVSIIFMEHLWKSDFKNQNNDRRIKLFIKLFAIWRK